MFLIDFVYNDLNTCLYQTVSTAQVYESSCPNAITSVLSGINATIFAYGQTGTGKTHTMMGNLAEPGLAMLFARDLLLATTQTGSNIEECVLELSFLQVYGNHVTDLLGDSKLNLKVRSTNVQVEVEGLTTHPIHSEADVLRLVAKGPLLLIALIALTFLLKNTYLSIYLYSKPTSRYMYK